jgi:hypothetical protein
MKLLITSFEEQRPIPMYSALTESKVDERILKKLKRCWDYDPDKRPSAADICKLFKGLQLVDNRNCRDGTADPRATPDNTEINYDFVLEILQRVSLHFYHPVRLEIYLVHTGSRSSQPVRKDGTSNIIISAK